MDQEIYHTGVSIRTGAEQHERSTREETYPSCVVLLVLPAVGGSVVAVRGHDLLQVTPVGQIGRAIAASTSGARLKAVQFLLERLRVVLCAFGRRHGAAKGGLGRC